MLTLFKHKKLNNLKKYSEALLLTIVFFYFFPSLSFATANKTGSCANINIIQKPIIFDKKRVALTRQYRLEHYGIDSQSIIIEPLIIVLHWTCSKNLLGVYNTFNQTTLQDRPEIQASSTLNVSAHFLVDRDGKIYQLMPTNWMARHTIGLNDSAIGIENIGGVNSKEDLTQAQIDANVALIRCLKKQYPRIQYLIGHYEYGKFRNSKLWKEKDKNYFTNKVDPGKRFMSSVREALKN